MQKSKQPHQSQFQTGQVLQTTKLLLKATKFQSIPTVFMLKNGNIYCQQLEFQCWFYWGLGCEVDMGELGQGEEMEKEVKKEEKCFWKVVSEKTQIDMPTENILLALRQIPSIDQRKSKKTYRLSQYNLQTSTQHHTKIPNQSTSTLFFLFTQSSLLCICSTHNNPTLKTLSLQFLYYRYPLTENNMKPLKVYNSGNVFGEFGGCVGLEKIDDVSVVGVKRQYGEAGEIKGFGEIKGSQVVGWGCCGIQEGFSMRRVNMGQKGIWKILQIHQINSNFIYLSLEQHSELSENVAPTYYQYLIPSHPNPCPHPQKIPIQIPFPLQTQFSNFFKPLPYPSRPRFYLDIDTFQILDSYPPKKPSSSSSSSFQHKQEHQPGYEHEDEWKIKYGRIETPAYERGVEIWVGLNQATGDLVVRRNRIGVFGFGGRVLVGFLLLAVWEFQEDLMQAVVELCLDQSMIM